MTQIRCNLCHLHTKNIVNSTVPMCSGFVLLFSPLPISILTLCTHIVTSSIIEAILERLRRPSSHLRFMPWPRSRHSTYFWVCMLVHQVSNQPLMCLKSRSKYKKITLFFAISQILYRVFQKKTTPQSALFFIKLQTSYKSKCYIYEKYTL